MISKIRPIAASASDSNQWTWKHVALGAAGVLLIGISSYGIYSFLIKSDDSSSEKKSNKRSKTPQSTISTDKSEASTSKTPLETAVEAKTRGNKYFKAREYQKAIQCYESALGMIDELPLLATSASGDSLSTELNSDEEREKLAAVAEKATFHHNLAAAYEKLENHQDVIRECSNCLQINPKYVKALVKRAKAYKSIEDLESAMHDIAVASVLEELTNIENMSLSEEITKKLAEQKAKEKFASKTERQPPSKSFVKNYFESFTFDIFDCDVDEEIENVNIEGSLNGFLKAKECFEAKDYDKVEDYCTFEIDKVGVDSPYYTHALLVRGSFRLLSGASKEAFADLDRVIGSPAASPLQKSNALIKRGSLNMQLQEHFSAIGDFEKASDVAKDSVDAHHHRGQLFLLLDDMEKCVLEFKKSIKLDPTFEQPAVQLCYANYKIAATQRDITAARECLDEFKQVLKRFPRSSDGHAMYAQALADSGQATEALDMFDKAISLTPGNAANYVHKGMLVLQLKNDTKSALDLINQGLEREPNNDFAYEMLANIEIKRGDYGAALKALEKAIDCSRAEVEMGRLYFMYLSAKEWKYIKEQFGLDVSKILEKQMQMM